MEDKLLVLQMAGYILAITQSELTTLLTTNRELWAECVRRGKGIMRQRKEGARKAKPAGDGMRRL